MFIYLQWFMLESWNANNSLKHTISGMLPRKRDNRRNALMCKYQNLTKRMNLVTSGLSTIFNKGTIYLTVMMILWLSVSSANTAPTGLNVIPSAYLLPSGSVSLEFQTDGAGGRIFGETCQNYINTQVGVMQIAEVGVDICTGHINEYIYNAKLVLLNEKERSWIPSLGVGIQNLSTNSYELFLVFSRTINSLKMHLGLSKITVFQDSLEIYTPLSGLEYQITESVLIYLDYQTKFSAGIAIQLHPVVSLLVATTGWLKDDNLYHSINLAWQISLVGMINRFKNKIG